MAAWQIVAFLPNQVHIGWTVKHNTQLCINLCIDSSMQIYALTPEILPLQNTKSSFTKMQLIKNIQVLVWPLLTTISCSSCSLRLEKIPPTPLHRAGAARPSTTAKPCAHKFKDGRCLQGEWVEWEEVELGWGRGPELRSHFPFQAGKKMSPLLQPWRVSRGATGSFQSRGEQPFQKC